MIFIIYIYQLIFIIYQLIYIIISTDIYIYQLIYIIRISTGISTEIYYVSTDIFSACAVTLLSHGVMNCACDHAKVLPM